LKYFVAATLSLTLLSSASAEEKRDRNAAFHTPGLTLKHQHIATTSPLPFIFGCAGGIIFTAIWVSRRYNRELTWNEAASCGVYFWVGKK
jgi:hypothetical protein